MFCRVYSWCLQLGRREPHLYFGLKCLDSISAVFDVFPCIFSEICTKIEYSENTSVRTVPLSIKGPVEECKLKLNSWEQRDGIIIIPQRKCRNHIMDFLIHRDSKHRNCDISISRQMRSQLTFHICPSKWIHYHFGWFAFLEWCLYRQWYLG